MKTITVFALQALRFQRPDFNIGLVDKESEPGKLKSVGISEAFVYLACNEITTVPAWVAQTPTFKHYEKHGLLKLYDAPPSTDRAAIEVAAAAAEAKLATAGGDPEPAAPPKNTDGGKQSGSRK